jgi:hypothetical protein
LSDASVPRSEIEGPAIGSDQGNTCADSKSPARPRNGKGAAR